MADERLKIVWKVQKFTILISEKHTPQKKSPFFFGGCYKNPLINIFFLIRVDNLPYFSKKQGEGPPFVGFFTMGKINCFEMKNKYLNQIKPHANILLPDKKTYLRYVNKESFLLGIQENDSFTFDTRKLPNNSFDAQEIAQNETHDECLLENFENICEWVIIIFFV
jgi:hypothetical protein